MPQDRGEESVIQYDPFIARLRRDEGMPHVQGDAVDVVLE
jgi:hypothetical protein